MTKVVVKNGKVDDALRNLKQKVNRDGLLKEIRKKEHYIKPSVRKKNQKKEYTKNSHKRNKNNR